MAFAIGKNILDLNYVQNFIPLFSVFSIKKGLFIKKVLYLTQFGDKMVITLLLGVCEQ